MFARVSGLMPRAAMPVAALLACLVLGPSAGSWAFAPFPNADKPFLQPEEVDLMHILPPPPAPGSERARADLDAVRRATVSRANTEEPGILADHECAMEQFAAVMGPGFDRQHMPRLAALLDQVYRDEKRIVGVTKKAINRDRPYALDPTLHTLGDRSLHQSYPSGHATFAYVFASVLAQVAPEKAGALFERAVAFANNRVKAGVHFPSDLEAGRISGAVIVSDLMRNERFQAQLQMAKVEMRGNY